jgi:hypothetical protein
MSKYIRLSESQLVKIIKKIINEEDETNFKEPDLDAIAMVTDKPDNELDSQQYGLAEDDDDDDYDDDDDDDE